MDEATARAFLVAFFERLGRMASLATNRPASMPSALPVPATMDLFLPADAGRPGTLLVVIAGRRDQLDPSRWRVRRYRGDLFTAALGLNLPGRWPDAGLPRVMKNLQLIDMTPVDERQGSAGVLIVDGCRFAESAPRPGFRRAREKEIQWASFWLRVPERYFTRESAEAQADACFAFYRSLPPAIAADGAGSTLVGARAWLEDLLFAYRGMLRDPSTTEAQLHSFLKQHPEFFGIFPWMCEEFTIRDPRTAQVKYRADFAFRRAEGDYDFYEIEKSTDLVIRRSGDLAAKVNHALEQVESWFGVLEGDVQATSAALPGFVRPRGFAVVGVREGMGVEEVEKFRRHDRAGGRITLLFFDDLADRMAAFIDSLPG
jgi:hypothetical protein